MDGPYESVGTESILPRDAESGFVRSFEIEEPHEEPKGTATRRAPGKGLVFPRARIAPQVVRPTRAAPPSERARPIARREGDRRPTFLSPLRPTLRSLSSLSAAAQQSGTMLLSTRSVASSAQVRIVAGARSARSAPGLSSRGGGRGRSEKAGRGGAGGVRPGGSRGPLGPPRGGWEQSGGWGREAGRRGGGAAREDDGGSEVPEGASRAHAPRPFAPSSRAVSPRTRAEPPAPRLPSRLLCRTASRSCPPHRATPAKTSAPHCLRHLALLHAALVASSSSRRSTPPSPPSPPRAAPCRPRRPALLAPPLSTSSRRSTFARRRSGPAVCLFVPRLGRRMHRPHGVSHLRGVHLRPPGTAA